MSDFYCNRPVLILGGLGFIGSNLALRLVERSADVTLVDAMIPGQGANLFNIEPVRQRVHVNVADVRDIHSLEHLVRGAAVIFSLAGQVSHLASMHEPLEDLDVNCRSQLALLECCRKRNPSGKIVFASTRQIYGRPRYLPVDERHPAAPVDANGVSKLAAEMYFALYYQVYGLRSVCLRLTNTYGPRLNLRGKRTGFLGVFILRALLQSTIEVYGTGEQCRDFNYVDDVVEALLLAGEDDRINGGSFNLGHPRHHSLLELVRILQQHARVGYRCVPFPSDRAAIEVGNYYGDFSKFSSATGWQPRVDLEQGIAETLKFFRTFSKQYWEAGHDPDIRLSQRVSELQNGN